MKRFFIQKKLSKFPENIFVNQIFAKNSIFIYN